MSTAILYFNIIQTDVRLNEECFPNLCPVATGSFIAQLSLCLYQLCDPDRRKAII
jgi:hypothetical protein